MTRVAPGVVDVYVIQADGPVWQVLLLERAAGTRCPLTWETVHGHIEAGERPEQAALREVREETGLAVDRLYNVTVQPFYLHAINTVQLAVVFAAFVKTPAPVILGPEHQAYTWTSVEVARARFVWPRCRTALDEIVALLSQGHAGPVEDVLRVL
jgi:8-oxo-dGTP pyrophosphatase MutT (NUDIX family)